jgi:type IV secretion system protein VirB1
VHADTARALVSVESAFNPWAIGVVGGALVRQPRHRAEAMATAKALQAAGWNFSIGLGQINVATSTGSA